MFINLEDKANIEYYKKMLEILGSFSGLFSNSSEPYIQYRVAENLFCKAFKANNLSRSDCSADASKKGVGIGIKTFLEKNGATMQKVAEFNNEHHIFSKLDLKNKILKISQLRNERIEATKRIFGLNSIIYHCLTRKKNGIKVYETPMDPIEISSLQNQKEQRNIISFRDQSNEYSFNITKSTLYKRFITKSALLDIKVEVLKDPFETLEILFKKENKSLFFETKKTQEHIYLPLYSIKNGKKYVPEKSGLNQWNAQGRKRNSNEAYIRIPAWIHKAYAGFFPPRDTGFELALPNGSKLDASVCQDGSKALMSNPNSALGEWLLRDVLNLKDKELLTYNKLSQIGLDSVVIYKNIAGHYDINFTKSGSYEDFFLKNEQANDSEHEI